MEQPCIPHWYRYPVSPHCTESHQSPQGHVQCRSCNLQPGSLMRKVLPHLDKYSRREINGVVLVRNHIIWWSHINHSKFTIYTDIMLSLYTQMCRFLSFFAKISHLFSLLVKLDRGSIEQFQNLKCSRISNIYLTIYFRSKGITVKVPKCWKKWMKWKIFLKLRKRGCLGGSVG